MRIVLASQSPSRLSILRSAGVEPLIHPAHVDEDALLADAADASPVTRVALLATAKAEAVAAEYPGDVVIGADSMLLLNGQLQGKPHTVAATVARWEQQAGQRAELLTGHCVLGPDGLRKVATSTTVVHFADASPTDIRAYATTGEPLECAGAFTLEALGGWFIDRIEGDPSSVIGLSLPLVRQALYEFGHPVSTFWNR